MSSYDDRLEAARDARIAKHLGLTESEYAQLAPQIDTNESDDGLIYSYLLNFDHSSPPELLLKVRGLERGSFTMEIDEDLIS